MANLHYYEPEEADNVIHTGGDFVAYHNDGDGNMHSVDVTKYKKVMIFFGSAYPGIEAGGNLIHYGLTFTRKAAETFSLSTSASILSFELNLGVIEITIPVSIDGALVDQSAGDSVWMNFRGASSSLHKYSYWLT